MFGSDDHQQDNNDDVDQAAAAAASDHGSFDDNQAPAPSGDTPLPTPPSDNAQTVPDPAASAGPTVGGNDDLLNNKQEALKQLSPLVGHLDQSPEEKFRTTMMMIQASDDQNLVKTAYEAAQAITDEKARAQALLDIINEINYFTQNHAS
jgi:hypothetical protein